MTTTAATVAVCDADAEVGPADNVEGGRRSEAKPVVRDRLPCHTRIAVDGKKAPVDAS